MDCSRKKYGEFMKKIVLITGAAGFLGKFISRKFSSEGWYVIGIGHSNWSDFQKWGVDEWIQSEITLNALQQIRGNVNLIVHCAGGASVSVSLEHPRQDFISTVSVTNAVLEHIRVSSPGTSLVYLSSAAVYGQQVSLPIREGVELRPVSPYGVHKMMAEDLCKSYAQSFQLKVAIVRLFSVYGDGLQKQLLWDACEKFKNQSNQFFGSGNEIRDWLHVDDAVDLIFVLQAYATENCPIFNGGCGQGVSIKVILSYLATKFDKTLIPEFSSKSKTGDPLAYVADISCAKNLGWSPKINWKFGVEKYVNWYKKCQ